MMCAGQGGDVDQGFVGMEYCDEQTWKKLDPILVGQGKKAELDRFKHIVVCEYVSRDEAHVDVCGESYSALQTCGSGVWLLYWHENREIMLVLVVQLDDVRFIRRRARSLSSSAG